MFRPRCFIKEMRSVTLAFAILLAFFTVASFPQDGAQSIKWARIEATEDGFSVEAPETFKYERDKVLGRFNEGRGEYLSDGLYLYAFVDRIKDARQYEVVEEFVKAGGQSGSVGNIGGQQITKYEFATGDRYFHTVVFTRSENRSFAFHAVSRTARNPSVARFIKSIRFGAEPNVEPVVEEEQKPAPVGGDLNLDLDTVSAGTFAGTGRGYGSGSGNGSSNSGDGTPSVKKIEIVPVKVLSKQKAQYTNWARFYNISGSVTLRVTFKADNTIGAISIIRSLPFGLTEAAITAAREIKFEAGKANGQPRTTTRPVAFLFNIY